jgi:DUF1680 family protein
MYITGGVGSRAAGEAIGEPYELPNAQAYGESCAAIANLMWNWRMLTATGDSRFVDVMERALYNGINSGMSLSGTLYCYRNPLESTGEKIRNEWYDTTCCPPNIERTLAALPGYMYTASDRGVYVNLFHSSTLDWHLADGTGLRLEQKTGYPWSDAVELTVAPKKPAEFSIYVRVPAWSGSSVVTVNGKRAEGPVNAGEFFEIRRQWNSGDRVRVTFDMTPQLIESNPLVRENTGRVAVQRGPLVYCLEQTDQTGVRSLFDAALVAGKGQTFQSEFRKDLLGGILVLKHGGVISPKPLADEPLYRKLGPKPKQGERVPLTFIPYYAWANRGPEPMQVWIPVQREDAFSAQR